MTFKQAEVSTIFYRKGVGFQTMKLTFLLTFLGSFPVVFAYGGTFLLLLLS
jgi:hypothetical protein